MVQPNAPPLPADGKPLRFLSNNNQAPYSLNKLLLSKQHEGDTVNVSKSHSLTVRP